MSTDTIAIPTTARALFEAMASAPGFADFLREADHQMQFMPLEGSPFSVTVEGGVLTISDGEKYPPTLLSAIHVVEVQACLADLFAGRMTLGEGIFHHRIRIPGYRNKEPRIARMSRLLRLAIWQFVPGAPILKPAK